MQLIKRPYTDLRILISGVVSVSLLGALACDPISKDGDSTGKSDPGQKNAEPDAKNDDESSAETSAESDSEPSSESESDTTDKSKDEKDSSESDDEDSKGKEDSSSDDSGNDKDTWDFGRTPQSQKELCEMLKRRPTPTDDGKSLVKWWESFVMDYRQRQLGSKKNPVAAKYLESQLQSFGYQTRILELKASGRTVRVVEGILKGQSDPDTYTVIGAHYDHVPANDSGAYDNASGVTTVISLCRQLAKVKTNRSLACLFFDGEENGLYGSRAWVRDVANKSPNGYKVAQMFGYDMAGINWPGREDWPLYGTLGIPKSQKALREPHAKLIETTLLRCIANEIGMKPEGLDVLRVYDKSSDEISFMRAGIPAVRFFGGRQATDYRYYHKSNDTIEGVYEVAGGQRSFERGLEMAVNASYYSVLAFDMFDPKKIGILPE